jgi:hypothetical protein
MGMYAAMAFMVVMSCGGRRSALALHQHKMHAALGAVARVILADFRMHRTGVQRRAPGPQRRGR